MSTAPTRRLILVRHAKAEQPTPGQADTDRPLARRGLLDAGVGGEELAKIAVPDVVLCSPSRRTRQTWRSMLDGLLFARKNSGNDEPVVHPEAHYLASLYEASMFDVVETVRANAEEASVVLVVGHEPTMSEATLALAGPGSEPEAVKQVRAGFSTGGIAVLAVEREWAELAPGDGRLEQFLVPRLGESGSIG